MPDMSLVFGDPSSTCSLADIECMESDRVEVCIWPDYLGEQPADVVCELGGCDTISGCMLDYPRSCTDDQISADCFSCIRRVEQMEARSDVGMVINCMAPAVPLVEVCPDGTTLAPDAVTPTIGECRHECHSDDAWNQDHACFPLISNGQFDWNNNTCGVGTCDMHSTPAACEANSGFWREDELFSEQTCSHIQMVGSYISFADSSAQFTAMMVSMAGPTCCTGFDADAYFTCTDSDMSIFVRLATGHPRRCLPHCCLHAKAAALSFAKQG